jgi:hypothetical protein
VSRKYLPRSFDYRDSRVETVATSGFLSSAQIANHTVARIRCSLTAGTDLALMKTTGMVPHGTRVIATKAKVTDDRGSCKMPASHAIPCGISVFGRGPLHMIPRFRKMQEFIAEPYKYTNIVPKATNNADSLAEAFKRQDGTGLVKTFERFCQRVLDTTLDSRGVLNRAPLKAAFGQLMEDYQLSFSIVLKNFQVNSSGRVTYVPGFGVEVDPEIPYTDLQFHADNILTALRGQLTALKEIEGSAFSNMLVQQVESEFHAVAKEGQR